MEVPPLVGNRHWENRERRERRSQILEGKMNFGRLFWTNLILADSLFFKIFFFVNLGRWRFKVGQIRGERHLLGGCDAYLEIYLADIFPRKKARSQTIWGILDACVSDVQKKDFFSLATTITFKIGALTVPNAMYAVWQSENVVQGVSKNISTLDKPKL